MMTDLYSLESEATYVVKNGKDTWNNEECESYWTRLDYYHRQKMAIREKTYVKDGAIIAVTITTLNYTDPLNTTEIQYVQYELKPATVKRKDLIMPQEFTMCNDTAYANLRWEEDCEITSSSSKGNSASTATVATTALALMMSFVILCSFF